MHKETTLAKQLHAAATAGFCKVAKFQRLACWTWEALPPAKQQGWLAAARCAMRWHKHENK
jgi:hypothetical protein